MIDLVFGTPTWVHGRKKSIRGAPRTHIGPDGRKREVIGKFLSVTHGIL